MTISYLVGVGLHPGEQPSNHPELLETWALSSHQDCCCYLQDHINQLQLNNLKFEEAMYCHSMILTCLFARWLVQRRP